MPRPLLGRQEHPPSQRPRQQIHRQPPPYRPRNPRTPLPHRPRPHPQHPQPHGYRPHHRRTFVHRSLSINTRLVIHHRPHPTRLLSAAQVFPMIGTRFRRFPMIGSQFRGFFQPLEPGFPPAFLPLSSRRARLEAAPPEGGLSASGGATSCRAAGGASRPGEPFPLARLGGDASPHRLLPPPAFPPALIARRGRRDVEHRFADIEKRFCPFHSSPTPSTFFCTFPCCPCTFFWEPPSRFPPARLEAAPPEAARQMATVI